MPCTSPADGAQARWCATIAAALAAGGCAAAVACPGLRNSPLLFALERAFGARCLTHWDERAAAFHALGMARALGRPVAVCVTSGTAAANLLPAACEADASRAPLVLLTANRPRALHGWGAPQTMPQAGLFGPFAELVELPEAQDDEGLRARLAQRLRRAVAEARRPLHLEVPLGEPEAACAPPPALAPLARAEQRAAPTRLPELPRAARGVIVAGPRPAVPAAWAAALAAATGFPVLADLASGLRRPGMPGLVRCPEARYGDPPAAPELIVRLGPPPLSRAGHEWLARQRCPQLLIGDARDDWVAAATHLLGEPGPELLDALGAALGPAPEGWAARWQTGAAEAEGWHPTAVADLAWRHADADLVWVGNSMAVRDLDLVAGPSARTVLAHRGLAGIDGTLAAAAGACRAAGARTLCLLGDLAALHDLSSLALAVGLPLTVVIINDGGGGIFDRFPVAALPGYRQLVRCDHAWDFAHAAAQFGLPYARCRSPEELRAALAEANAQPGASVIECPVHGADARGGRARALAAALQSAPG